MAVRGRHSSERCGKQMKVEFCFPGQGSLEPGMGRDVAEAVTEAMEVYERGGGV